MTLQRPLAALLLAAGIGAPAAPVNYRFDPTHSFVSFELTHFGTSTIRGRFGPLEGEVTLDREARTGHVQVTIATAQVSTGLAVLDAQIRGDAMLASDANPKAYFVAERFEFDNAGAVKAVRGEFTLRGTSRPLALTAQRFRCYPSPLFRREVCGGDFVGELERSDYGISHSLPFISDAVTLRVQVEAVRSE